MSTPGALSRRTWRAESPDALRQHASWAEFDEFVVDGGKVDALRTQLEGAFAAKLGQRVRRAELDMDFVPTEPGYWFGCTCADLAADWLQSLDCTVSWVPIRASLRR